MRKDSGPNLPPFPSSYRASACFCTLPRCPRPMGLATWDQPRSPGSINFPMQGKGILGPTSRRRVPCLETLTHNS